MGTISKASMSTRTQASNYQCQTKGYNLIGFNMSTRRQACKLLMPNQWEQSRQD